jgi:hypothetical protein
MIMTPDPGHVGLTHIGYAYGSGNPAAAAAGAGGAQTGRNRVSAGVGEGVASAGSTDGSSAPTLYYTDTQLTNACKSLPQVPVMSLKLIMTTTAL